MEHSADELDPVCWVVESPGHEEHVEPGVEEYDPTGQMRHGREEKLGE